METAELELEYRLLKDKCTSVIDALKCRQQVVIPPKEKTAAMNNGMNLLNNKNDFRENFHFAVPDYLSVIDHLASDKS